MTFTVHHMRVLMLCTIAWATISVLAVAWSAYFRENDVLFAVLPLFLLPSAVAIWWTIRLMVLLRPTRLFAVVRGVCGLLFGGFNCFIWGFTFETVRDLDANRMIPHDWQWTIPALMAGAVIGLIAGTAEATELAVRADAGNSVMMRSVMWETLRGAMIGGTLLPILLCGCIGGTDRNVLIFTSAAGFLVVGAVSAFRVCSLGGDSRQKSNTKTSPPGAPGEGMETPIPPQP